MAARDQAAKQGRKSRLFVRPTSIRPDLAPADPSIARVSTRTLASYFTRRINSADLTGFARLDNFPKSF
jgi:hypothetical protein